jgi:hypothetical protein
MEHRNYVQKRERFPIKIAVDKQSAADKILLELAAETVTPKPSDGGRAESWISMETWKLIDQKANARRLGKSNLAAAIGQQVRKSLQKDRQTRINLVAEEIEARLKAKDIETAYAKLQCWYRNSTGKVPKPTYQDEEKTRNEYKSLFSVENPPGEPILVNLDPKPEICDDVPTEEEVKTAIRTMKQNKSPGASGIRVEHLRLWMEGAMHEERPIFVKEWEKVLKLVKMAFTGVDIPSSFCNGILVLIPKTVPGEYRGIALLEVIYKLISSIINRRLVSGIQWHDAIHGFRTGRGTGTAIIEAKLRMQLAQRSHKPLYMIFLDLKKAYDTLDRDRTMLILEQYGVGKNTREFIKKIWEGDTMVPKQAGFFGKPFQAKRGVRQGDIISPTLFNIIVNTVVQEWKAKTEHAADEATIRQSVEGLFYADDGLLASEDPNEAQGALDILTDGFSRVGLKMNAAKTEAMVVKGGKVYEQLSKEAYARKATGTGATHRERSLEKIQCNLCGDLIGRQHLIKHQQTKKCKDGRMNYEHMEEQNEQEGEPNLSNEQEPKHYILSLEQDYITNCPVESCPAKVKTPGEMRKHFRNRHLQDTIVIEEEGPLPQCIKCGLFQSIVGERHQRSADCRRFTEIREKREQAKVQRAANDFNFTVNGTPIKYTKEFKYLGRILEENDSDQPAISRNLQRAREKWGMIGRILSKKGANPKVMATFYKTIVQSVLLYGAESWVISKHMMSSLRSFHRRCARFITGKHIWQDIHGNWHQPSSKETLEAAGLWTIEEYIRRRKATVMAYVKDRPIYQRCMASKLIASNVNQLVWWTDNTIENDA